MFYLLLSEGFEEMEALVTVDILRRAGLPVTTVGIGGRTVLGAHQIAVCADVTGDAVELAGMTGVILPGGPGTPGLEKAPLTAALLDHAAENGLLIAAICAAPSILGHRGLLKGRRATCFPGYEETLAGAEVCSDPAVADGNIITGKGAGASLAFALKIVEICVSPEKAETLKAGLQCQ